MAVINLNESELQPQFDSFERVALRRLAQAVLDDVIDNHIVTELADLSDVDAALPDDGDTLIYNSGTETWEAGPSSGGLFPLVTNADIGGISAELDWASTTQYFTNADNLVLITIPDQDTLAWADDTTFEIIQGGTTGIVVQGEDDCEILYNGSALQTSHQGGKIVFRRLAEDLWAAWGDVQQAVPASVTAGEYTPTLTPEINAGGTNSVISAWRYSRVGDTVFCQFNAVVDSNASGGEYSVEIAFSLPVATTATTTVVGSASCYEQGTDGSISFPAVIEGRLGSGSGVLRPILVTYYPVDVGIAVVKGSFSYKVV